MVVYYNNCNLNYVRWASPIDLETNNYAGGIETNKYGGIIEKYYKCGLSFW